MKRVLQGILILLVLAVSVSALTLIQNDVPWNKPPGFLKRLTVYLTRNVAETSDTALFPELRTRTYNITANSFMDQLIPHLIFLGWEVQGVDKDRLSIDAVVRTPLLGFKDDIHIRLEPVAKKQTRLHIRASSRVGRADYAANLGHILRLYQEIELAELD